MWCVDVTADLVSVLKAQLDHEGDDGDGDIRWVLGRGRTLRRRRRSGFALLVTILAIAAYGTAAQFGPARDEVSPATPSPETAVQTYNYVTVVSTDFTAPLFLQTELLATDELFVRAVKLPPRDEVPSAVVVSFPGPLRQDIALECIVAVELGLYSLGTSEAEETIAAYPSRIFDARDVERQGRLADDDGALISNAPRGHPPAEIRDSAWVTWDVTDVYKHWFSERRFAGYYENLEVPEDEIVFALRDESGEGPRFMASFASLEYAQAHSPDAPDALAPQLRMSIEESC